MARRTLCLLFGAIMLPALLAVAFPPLRPALLFATAALVLLSLAVLQVRFFRRGDAKRRTDRREPAPEPPPYVRSERHRRTWQALEAARRTISLKEREARKEELAREQRALGLPPEETLCWVGGPSWLYAAPFLCLAVALFGFSLATSGELSFAFLSAGCVALLAALRRKYSRRYYLSSFRILLSQQRVPGGGRRWHTMRYDRLTHCFLSIGLGTVAVTLRSQKESLCLVGLSQADLHAILRTLRKHSPLVSCASQRGESLSA